MTTNQATTEATSENNGIFLDKLEPTSSESSEVVAWRCPIYMWKEDGTKEELK